MPCNLAVNQLYTILATPTDDDTETKLWLEFVKEKMQAVKLAHELHRAGSDARLQHASDEGHEIWESLHAHSTSNDIQVLRSKLLCASGAEGRKHRSPHAGSLPRCLRFV